jgi:ABC-2 type transport system ATP-binding protein
MSSDAQTQPTVETDQLTRRFGHRLAVDHLNLRIPTGSVYGLIGPNGAGKTTTIKLLMHMLQATSGAARIFGLDVTRQQPALRQRVGYVPELHFIYRWMRVHEAISFCQAFYTNWNDQRCAELLKLFDLDVDKKVRALSKGMVAKLALLLGLAHEPKLLILDEPTSGLDPLVREEFLDGVLRVLCDGEQTVLFSSHMLSDVQRLADRVGIIYEGCLLADCAMDELLQSTKRVRVVLANGTAPGPPPEGTVWQRLEHRQWILTVHGFGRDAIEQLQRRHPAASIDVSDLSLEDIFKDFIKGRRGSA